MSVFISMVIIPFYVLGICWLARKLEPHIPDGAVKRVLYFRWGK